MSKRDIMYTLNEPFEYAFKGEQEAATFITLLPPTARHIANIAPVKSYIMQAIEWVQNLPDADTAETVEGDGSGGDVESIDPKVMMNTLDRAPGVEVAKVLLHINEMLTSGLALVEGETRFTKPMLDRLSIPDIYGIAGTFIVNFIVPSL